MRLVAITPEEAFSGEAQAIEKVLEAGFYSVHLRMPHATVEQARAVMEDISPKWHSRIMLASHYELNGEFNFGGAHLKQGMSIKPEWESLPKSRSYHYGDSLDDITRYDYAFISPVFDSISKQGYQSAFSAQMLSEMLKSNADAHQRLVALGGISAKQLPQVAAMGFTGAAMLGYLWSEPDTLGQRLNEINDYIKTL